MARPRDESIANEAFVCRRCDRALEESDGGDAIRCPETHVIAPIEGRVPRFPVDSSSGFDPFDRLAPIYESPLWFQPLYRLLVGPGGPPDDRKPVLDRLALDGGVLLDIACGTGRLTRLAAQEADRVIAVDRSDGMLDRARRYVDRGRRDADRDGFETITFARMDATELWLETDAVDGVACCWVLHLVDDLSSVLAEIRRVLVPNGPFAGTTLANRGVMALPGMRVTARCSLGAETFSEGALRTALSNAGFDRVHVDRYGAALFFLAR